MKVFSSRKFVFMFHVVLFIGSVLFVSAELENEEDLGENQGLEKRCPRRGRMYRPGQGLPSFPATEETLRKALSENVCSKYNPNYFFPLLNRSNLMELLNCQAAARYLMSSSTKRPDDCSQVFGVRCGRDAQNKMVCMLKTEVGFMYYEEKPLSHCAQFFKPATTNPTDTPTNTKPVTPVTPVTPATDPAKPATDGSNKLMDPVAPVADPLAEPTIDPTQPINI